MINYKLKNSKGFTLTEILIYLGIFALVGGFLVDVLVNALEVNTESQSVRTVTEEGRFIVETVKRVVRDSSLIDIGTTTPQGTLILRMNDYANNRDFIHIYASGTRAYMAEGVIDNTTGASSTCPSSLPPVCVLNALTDERVNVDSLSFKRFSNAPGHDSLQIDFTLSYASTKAQSQFSKAFRTSVARVSAAVFDSSLIPNGSNLSVGVSGQKWQDGYFSGLLDITGNLTVGSNILRVNTSNSRVGIGTVTPAKKLHVSGGDIYIDGNGRLFFYATSTCYTLSFNQNGTFATSSVACP